jgi:ribA/ribD-fused uncharacterized protein
MENLKKNNNKALFYQEEFEYFSNFSAYQIEYDGLLWPTTEHAYQAAKFSNKKIKNNILKAKTPLEAFSISRDPKNILRKDWFKIRVKIMEDIIREKVKQHPYVYSKLIETGDKEIIEASPIDSFWGWGSDKKGENQLGKIWMKIREEIINNK